MNNTEDQRPTSTAQEKQAPVARWQDLFEQADHILPEEWLQQKRRRLIGLILGPTLFLLMFLLDPPTGVSPKGMLAMGIFLWTVVWWVCETIPIPVMGLLCLSLLPLCGVLTVEQAFSYLAHWVNIFLIGAFIIGHALNIHGLNRRFAFKLISHRLVGGSPWRLTSIFLIGAALLSMIASNVVSTVVFMAIAQGIFEAMKIPRGSAFGGVFFIAIAWATDLGGIATPIGTPPNLLAIALTERLGYSIGFLQWMLVGVPVMVVGMILMLSLVWWIARKDLPDLRGTREYALQELERMGGLQRGEKIALGALVVALFLWMLPDLSRLVLGPEAPLVLWLRQHLSWSVVSILVAVSLFLIPVDWHRRRFAMTWTEAVQGIEWGTLFLIAAALAIGTVIGDQELGWGGFLTNHFMSAFPSGVSPYVVVFMAVGLTVLLTNFISNNAAVMTIGTVILAMSASGSFPVNPVALLVAIGIASSMAFALPSATPPTAIVFASGRVQISVMARYGTILALLCSVLVAFGAYTLANWVFRF